MIRRSIVVLPILGLTLAMSLPTAAAELAGVSLPNTVEVDGKQLVLNGMGLREKFFIDVYVAGLYLPAKQRSGEAILAADTPRHLVMHFTYDVTKEQVCDAWKESLAANRPNASAALQKDFDTLCSWMADAADGERMAFTYVPGAGTTVEVKGEAKGTIAGKEFADALFASWIGAKPATGKLKKGLLGG
jgi:hypothetical protein